MQAQGRWVKMLRVENDNVFWYVNKKATCDTDC